MNTAYKTMVILLLTAAIGGTLAFKARQRQNTPEDGKSETALAPVSEAMETPKPEAQENTPDETQLPRSLPKLIDLGADKCIPCKAMAPILDELKKEYENRMEVQFIDVWKHPEDAEKFHIQLIPTQIFFDADGKERFRHEGFFSKEDILAKWKELGAELDLPSVAGQ